ncbi:MAG: hypothetical protein JJE04_24290 [Acidobacteriia bacterium]|nr:hypothetical protein [Terriglobia bacterium]
MPAPWFSDTDPKALEVYIQLHRDMTPSQRLARIFELCDFQQAMQLADIRAAYPKAPEREVFLRAASRRLGRDLMIKAYGWDPDLQP